MSIYTDIFKKNQFQLADMSKKSRSWFQQQARELGKQQIAPMRLIKSSADKNRMKVMPGELYLFMYDAKHQDTLPYWDMFPLVFPFRKLPDGFMGLNLHYLPYQMRIILLDRLSAFRNNDRMDETTRLKYSWATIQGTSKLHVAEACVKRYLNTQIQSPLKRIDSADWATALMLPVERFVGASKQQVWTESMR